ARGSRRADGASVRQGGAAIEAGGPPAFAARGSRRADGASVRKGGATPPSARQEALELTRKLARAERAEPSNVPGYRTSERRTSSSGSRARAGAREQQPKRPTDAGTGADARPIRQRPTDRAPDRSQRRRRPA
ncbi:MAG TPA: hypothetical protein VLH79_06310, partial [Chthonomonadales bacterium]|nr:hypothetical protein [Chthonomonadales bacterium]